jgi:hypothetical protein
MHFAHDQHLSFGGLGENQIIGSLGRGRDILSRFNYVITP